MAFYAFALEPPLPRTEFIACSSENVGEACSDGLITEFELVIADALMAFPEAYRAVVENVRRWRDKLKAP